MTKNQITNSELAQKIDLHKNWLTNHINATSNNLSLFDALISNIRIDNEDVSEIELIRCEFREVCFTNCNLSSSLFIESLFNNCKFINCNFNKSDLRGVKCIKVNFFKSDFTRADFTDADLINTDLTNCTLDWAWLIRTDLRYAILDGATLKGTRFIETKIYNDRRFALGTYDSVTTKDVDVSPNADKTQIADVDVIQNFLLT